MIFFIVFSSIQLAIDSPLNDPKTRTSIVLTYLDYSITCIFVLEVIMKVIANGLLFCGSKSYLLNQLNVVDLFVVFITILSYLLSSLNLNAIKVLRMIKVFRPLRAISKN